MSSNVITMTLLDRDTYSLYSERVIW